MIALCLGGALSVWDDLAAAQAMVTGTPYIIVAANFAGIQYEGRIDGWATVHHEWFDGWREKRRALGRNDDYRAFIHEDSRGRCVSEAEIIKPWGRFSSGLFAAQCAIEGMGATGAILCGVPMDNTGGHIQHGGEWRHRHHYYEACEAVKKAERPIRSMSGWTQKLFGAPDVEFIASCQ